MTQTTVGTLWILDSDTVAREVLNDARSRKYNHLHPLWRGVSTDCGCASLNYNPLTTAALTFGAHPYDADVAPWYSSLIPNSVDFLGFFVDDVQGLDYSLIERTVNQRGGNGANATPLRMAGREITFTLTATALNEAGMRYGLDWLAQQLADIGGRCGYGRAMMRLYCSPDPMDLQDGRVELREVQLRSGPEWTSNVMPRAGCLVREVMFTLLAGDPCFYTGKSTCSVSSPVSLPAIDIDEELCTNGVTVAELLCGAISPGALGLDGMPCCEIFAPASLNTRAAFVTIQMVSGTAGPFMVETWHAPYGTDCNTVVANPANFVGRIGVAALSGTTGLLVDASQQIMWTRTSSGAEWEPDDSYFAFAPGETPFFPAYAGTDSMYVTVRPFYVCSGAGTFTVKIETESVSSCVVR